MRSRHHVAQAALVVHVLVSAAVKVRQKLRLLNISSDNLIKSERYIAPFPGPLGSVSVLLLLVENLIVFRLEDEQLHNTPLWN